ncbi:MAG: hypothetical protein QNJ36_02285 [Calothrix sp. MO_167.B42]|nr:hypothetical protein [Calothrix sp. MO_167.B42]
MQRRRPRTSDHKSTSAGKFLRVTNSLPTTCKEHQFYSLLLSLTAAMSKESSNNIAIVALAAMFFGFAILVLKPATSPANPPLINQQSNPITTLSH